MGSFPGKVLEISGTFRVKVFIHVLSKDTSLSLSISLTTSLPTSLPIYLSIYMYTSVHTYTCTYIVILQVRVLIARTRTHAKLT